MPPGKLILSQSRRLWKRKVSDRFRFSLADPTPIKSLVTTEGGQGCCDECESGSLGMTLCLGSKQEPFEIFLPRNAIEDPVIGHAYPVNGTCRGYMPADEDPDTFDAIIGPDSETCLLCLGPCFWCFRACPFGTPINVCFKGHQCEEIPPYTVGCAYFFPTANACATFAGIFTIPESGITLGPLPLEHTCANCQQCRAP